MKKDFNNFISHLKANIFEYETLVDVKKVKTNYDKWHHGFNDMNRVINDYASFYQNLDEILTKNPDLKEFIPLLFATRNEQKKMYKNGECLDFNASFPNVEAIEIIKHSPLDYLVKNKLITNINDYLIGIEVGLDTNARKNRTGVMMEKLTIDIINLFKLYKN